MVTQRKVSSYLNDHHHFSGCEQQKVIITGHTNLYNQTHLEQENDLAC